MPEKTPVRRSLCKIGRTRSGTGVVTIAVFMVSILLVSPFASSDVCADEEDATPYIPTPKDYLYELKTDETGTNIISVRSVEHQGDPLTDRKTVLAGDAYSDGDIAKLNSDAINELWEFDPVTGMGPFNCFYGAFNYSGTGNAYDHGEKKISCLSGRIAFVLNPYDLTKTLSGTSITKGNYNVFLVIPTVYWKAEGTTLYMSSSPEYTHSEGTVTGMVAYGHIAYKKNVYTGSDKHVFDTSLNGVDLYPYIGIGVYPASLTNDYMRSYSSGARPASQKTIGSFREAADKLSPASGSDFQMVNYYQWTLYKMMAYTIMGTKNAKYVLGLSNDATGSTYWNYDNGLGDKVGPVSSLWEDHVKLLIENPWGCKSDFMIGDCMFTSGNLYTGNCLGGRSLGTSVQSFLCSLPTSSGHVASVHLESGLWDTPNTVTSASSKGHMDRTDAYLRSSTDTNRIVKVMTGQSNQSIGSLTVSNSFGNYGSATTTRLSYYISPTAMLPDKDPETFTVYIQSNDATYGRVNEGTSLIFNNVLEGSYIEITDNRIVIDGHTAIATPSHYTDDYTFFFSDWDIPAETVLADITITANFYRLQNPKITFEMNGHGTQVPYQTPPVGGTVRIPAEPMEPDYSFSGWCADSELTHLWDFSTRVYEDMTLYALWDVAHHHSVMVSMVFETSEGGTVSPSIINAPLGSMVSIDGNRMRIATGPDIQVVRAIPDEGYAVDSWSVPEGILVTDFTAKVTFKKIEAEEISVYSAPIKLVYSPGEYFDPNGLTVLVGYDDHSEHLLQYRGNESLFSFAPSLDEPLKVTDRFVTISYGDVTVQQEISVQGDSPAADWNVVILTAAAAVIISILALSFYWKHPDLFRF